ncbi:amidohydrolase family protein [Cellulomonas denverensis]|uniref:Amidohydrolase family protein n=1 Tax=Cellulomonas denverensis TaxID=264297 RepID=A0A7X6KV28_9CELL|nr:amidohydrolase family protein [Cellulomonas denverensis]NKY22799.1 amidohydrolase family protein [Cellulomonas denverensis]GIG25260.1 amidohydrolase [Cellulomonas denverensis]
MTALHLRGPVIVDGDRVAAQAWVVGGRITFERPAEVDGSLDGWVLPGLVDVHCHIGLGAQGEVDRDTALGQARADRDAGVLLIRDAGSPADTRWMDDRDDLPRLIRAGRHLARPKRYLRHYARELADVAELPAAVAEEADRGDGWVKLVADWIDRDLGPDGDLRPLWPDDVLAEAVRVAHEHGARVTAHTFATEALDGLLDAGIDCLEHATGADPAQIDRIAAAGIPVTATLLQVAQFGAIADQAVKYPVYAARMRRMHGRRYAHVRNLYDAGVPLLLGTDAGGTIAHGRIADEAAELLAAGIADAEVVAAASWRTRGWLGMPGLVEGESADLVVYDADPRADARVLAAPRGVLLRGVRVA